MRLEQTPNIGPNALKKISEGVELSDASTRLSAVQLLNEQIGAYERQIAGRDISEESDLKNESDLMAIKELKRKITDIQQGKYEQDVDTPLTPEEEPYLRNN